MSEDIILRSLKFSGQYLSYTGHWPRPWESTWTTDILFCSWNLNNGQSKEMFGHWRTITKMKCDMGQLLLMTRTWCPRYEITRWITDIIVPYGTWEEFWWRRDPICSESPCLKSFILLKTSTVYDCADLLQIRRGDRPRTRYKYLIQTNWPGFWWKNHCRDRTSTQLKLHLFILSF